MTVAETLHNVLICRWRARASANSPFRFRNIVPGFLHHILSGLVIPGASQEQRYGCNIFQTAFNNPSAPIYASAGYPGELDRLELVEQALALAPERRRPAVPDLGRRIPGAGSLKEYQLPTDPRYAAPTSLVSAETSIMVQNEDC